MSETCRNGHPITEGSTYEARGRRYCKECRRLRKLRSYHKTGAARRRRHKIANPTWRTDEAVARARSLWDQGLSAAAVAAEIGNGCTKAAILRMARRDKWPAHPACKPITPQLGYSPAQADKIRAVWETKESVHAILAAVNAIGPKKLNENQLRKLAARMGLRRPVTYRHDRPKWGRALGVKRPDSPTYGAILIPLREVYQRAAQLELPRSKRGDIHALNAAMKRAKPEHPGFALADYQPTKLTWGS